MEDDGWRNNMTVVMPLFVMIPRKTMPDKKRIINLNYYRNWQGALSNIIKKAYTAIAIPRVRSFRASDGVRIGLTFKLFKLGLTLALQVASMLALKLEQPNTCFY